MKAISKLTQAPGLTLHQTTRPTPGHNDVLIRIEHTAICGTDMHIYHWDQWAQKTIPTPMVVGHEFVGRIEALGKEVSGYSLGDRVSGEGHITCGYCRNCRAGQRHLCRNTIGVGVNRDGAFADYLVIPASNVFKVPAEIPDSIAAILDPFGNAAHTALSYDLVGEDVLITGAGPIGIMAAAICRHVGARHVVITDINDYRLNLARSVGVSQAVNVTRNSLFDVMQSLKMQESFDVGLEMSGNGRAFVSMIEHMNHGGRIALLGIPDENTQVDWTQIVFKGLKIKGVYGREMYETWYKMISMLQSGLDISPVITHHFPIKDFQQAFDTMASGNSGKIILDWT